MASLSDHERNIEYDGEDQEAAQEAREAEARIPRHEEATRPGKYIQPPFDCIITVEDIRIFIPRSLIISDVAVRFQRNGVTALMASKLHLSARRHRQDDDAELQRTRDRVKRQSPHGGRVYCNVGSWQVSIAETHGRANDLTANFWRFKDEHARMSGTSRGDLGACSEPQEWSDVP